MSIDIIGMRFGRLKVISFDNLYTKHKEKLYTCECDCGNITYVIKGSLVYGYTKSCGCIHSAVVSKNFSTHKMSGTKIYRVWKAMKKRCQNPKDARYQDWGGRGIIVCEKWKTFEGFYKDMGSTYKEGLSIDRINVNSNYCKENCKWSTTDEQANNKRNTIVVTYKGENGTLRDMCRRLNLSYGNAYMRIRRGHSVEEALMK